MKSTPFNLSLRILLYSFICNAIAFANIRDQRDQAGKVLADGNYKEALELNLKNFSSISDSQSHQDYQNIMSSIQRLRKYDALKKALTILENKHATNSSVLLSAAKSFNHLPHQGIWLDNAYIRGANPYSYRTQQQRESAHSYEHDRVRALQYAERAYHSATNNDQKSKAVISWLETIMQGRQHQQSWKLQSLTDTKTTPAIQRGYRHSSYTKGAPVTASGDPLFYEIPASYLAAKNDGERWRWLLVEAIRLKPDSKSKMDYRLALFLHQQFSVRTLQTFSWYHRIATEDNNKSAVMQVHTLQDDETVARLANTLKRFHLPASQNYLSIYKNLWKNGKAHAADQLVSIYLDRRQYSKAAALLKKIIDTKGDDSSNSRKKQLDQITQDWSMFEHTSGAFTLHQPMHLGLIYRNADSVKLTIYPIDVHAIHKQAWDYLKTNPTRLNWNHLHWGNLLHETVNGSKNSYIGKSIAEQSYPLKPRSGHWDTHAELKLPTIERSGAFLVRSELPDGKKCYTLIWIDDMMISSRSVNEGTLFYVSDAASGKPIPNATLQFHGYKIERLNHKQANRRHNIITKKFTRKTDANGQVIIENKHKGYRWAVEATKADKSAWMGYNNIWSYDLQNSTRYSQRKVFAITSQPVYKPGSKVEGKFWIRDAKYDLGEHSNYAGKTFYISLVDPSSAEIVKEQKVIADDFGGVPFSYDIKEEATLGRYQVHLKNETSQHLGSKPFLIEQYKKPEYEVTVEAPKTPVLLGDSFQAKIIARYYHGAPVTDAKVKVTVLRHSHSPRRFPVGRWDWLYGNGYGWLGIEHSWYPGWQRWGCRAPSPWWHHGSYQQPELVLTEELKIGKEGSAHITIDSALAKLSHADQDHRYEIKVEVIDSSRRAIFAKGSVLATRQPFHVTTWLNRGHVTAGEKITANTTARTLDGKTVTGTGTMSLHKVRFSLDGKPTETPLQQWTLNALPGNTENTSSETFDPIHFQVNEPGQYKLVSLVKDSKGRQIEGAVLFTVRGTKGNKSLQNVRYNDLELIPDKRTYKAGENVKLLINTKRKNSYVMLFVKGSTERHFIKVEGHSHTIETPVDQADMPNFYIEAVTISNARIHRTTREIIVPPAKRILNVEVLPNLDKYKPRERGTVTIKVTGEDGKPINGDCMLSIYDKSLEYIAGGSNTPEIKAFFWKWRRHFSPTPWMRSDSFHGGTTVKNRAHRMQALGVFGRSLGYDLTSLSFASKKTGRGYHRRAKSPVMLQKNTASSRLEDSKTGSEPLQNDSAAKPQMMIRKDFADLVKWSGSVKLDAQGTATIPVDYPDNLTTWKIQTWAMAHGTKVGYGSAEVITSKDLIIRLQAPRFFLEKDEVVLSAIVHNYHKSTQQAKVILELEGGTLEVIAGDTTQLVQLAALNGEQRINWRVKVKGIINDMSQAVIRMKVITDNDSDAMQMTFPVYIHGMLKQLSWSREIAPGKDSTKIEIDVPAERRAEDSRLEVRYSPTIAGSIVDALPYLAEYPYGCTEQTLNRFVPTVITQKLLKDMGVDLEAVRNKRTNLNPQEIGDDPARMAQWKRHQKNPVFSQKEVAKMTRQGIAKLTEMQLSDGGWGWFSGYRENSYPHTTAVMLHGLKIAKDNGANIPENVITKGLAWLKLYEARETEKIRMWQKRDKNTKPHPSSTDAFVRLVLAEYKVTNQEMLNYQFRSKNNYGIYAKSLLAMSLHLVNDAERRDATIRNIEQFLHYDEENQTAYLEMRNTAYWWHWYGSEIEAHAWYLKLLTATKPESKQASGVVKYLINNRKHATYWNSTRDTAYCIEAIAGYMTASGESDPNAEVEVLFDGKSYKKVAITKENLFHFDHKMTLAGDILSTGKRTIEIRRKGKGALYTNAYLSVFTKEDHISKTGLEVKVERRFYKLSPKKSSSTVAGERGQVVAQKTEQYQRIPLHTGDTLKSGDIIEVELLMESKNDYEYLMLSDFKAAGTEAEKVRSGYTTTNSMRAYMEVRDEKVCFFIHQLPRGKHSISYRLRAEIPGTFSALPATVGAMYAPELRANSDEIKLNIKDE